MDPPGINKPFDRALKEFADEAPVVFLRLIGMMPPGEAFCLDPLRPESAPPVVMPDYVASLVVEGEEPCIFHVEFFVRYRREIPETMARYGGSLARQYRQPVKSVLLLLREDGLPQEVPSIGEDVIGETVIRHPFQTVRLWELDPRAVLESGDLGLMPWALLTRFGREEAAQLGLRIAASGRRDWVARFLTLGSLRYDREELKRMMGGPKMGFVEAFLEGSIVIQEERQEAKAEGLSEGRAEGLSQGMSQGMAGEARRILRLALASRFPGLESMGEIDQIHSVIDLEVLLLDHVMLATDRAAVESAIKVAANQKR